MGKTDLQLLKDHYAGARLRDGGTMNAALVAFVGLIASPVGAAAQDARLPEAVAAAVDRTYREAVVEGNEPGAVWSIVADGRIVHLGSTGVADVDSGRPIDGDTVFRIASMSKAFTALAILKLRDEGRLSLEAPAETYVPEMRGWTYPTSDAHRIRVSDLISHSAGFVTDDPWGDRQQDLSEADFTALLKQGISFTRAPQPSFEYSNLGYALLGRIITNVTGKPFDDYIVSEIMRPLGMTDSGYDIFAAPQERRAFGYRWENGEWRPEPTLGRGVFGAMGGVWTTANDYAKWVGFLLEAWPPRDGPETGPVRRATVRELAQGLGFPRKYAGDGLEPGSKCDSAAAYAKGFTLIDDCAVGLTLAHSGGYPGYGSNLRLLPERGMAAFVFANRTYASNSATNRAALVALTRAGVFPARAQPVSAELAGAYETAKLVWQGGGFGGLESRVAMNVALDESLEMRARDIAGAKARVGACDTAGSIVPQGALRGEFVWSCEKGRIAGDLILTPTAMPLIQHLSFTPEGANSASLADRYTDAWNSHDPSAVAAFYAPDGAIAINGGVPYEGRDGVARMAAGFYSDVPDLRLRTDAFTRAGDHAIYGWTFSGSYRDTGRPLVVSGWEEWDIGADGLIARSRGWFDAADYARQAGEQP